MPHPLDALKRATSLSGPPNPLEGRMRDNPYMRALGIDEPTDLLGAIGGLGGVMEAAPLGKIVPGAIGGLKQAFGSAAQPNRWDLGVQPKPGGALAQVLERGGEKQALGIGATPGEQSLMDYFMSRFRGAGSPGGQPGPRTGSLAASSPAEEVFLRR